MSNPQYPEMDTLPSVQPVDHRTWKEKLSDYRTYWTTKEGWIGDYVRRRLFLAD